MQRTSSQQGASIISQKDLNSLFQDAINGKREEPFKATKKSTKNVRKPSKGEIIQTWIDYQDTVILECERIVPDGVFIVISDQLKNSQEKKHEYFINFYDFQQRYTMLDGSTISDHDTLITETKVRAKGVVTAFKAYQYDTYNGTYQNPESWGKGTSSGASEDGYWLSSEQRPTEFYFMPSTHFQRDYDF